MGTKIKISVIFLVFVLIISLLVKQNKITELENQIVLKEQNITALNDSIRIEIDKYNKVTYSKSALISDLKDLKSLNNDLYSEIKKHKGKVSELSKYVITLESKLNETKNDSLIRYNDNEFGIAWENDTIYNKQNRSTISGVTKFELKFKDNDFIINPINTVINKNITTLNITQGLRKKGELLEIFVTSDHPDFKLIELNSFIINPKEHIINDYSIKKSKRFGFGLQAGYGLVKDKIEPYIGLGINYNILQF